MPSSVSARGLLRRPRRRLRRAPTISALAPCSPRKRRCHLLTHQDKTSIDQVRKTNTKLILGTAGTQAILEAISETGRTVGTVSIGGIKQSNVQRVLYQSRAPNKGLDGVAIVSGIMAADDPKAAAAEFVKLVASPPAFVHSEPSASARDTTALLKQVPQAIQDMVKAHPLVHNMINYVVANFVANVALSMYDTPSRCSHT